MGLQFGLLTGSEPGAMLFTRMPSRPTSSARLLAYATTPMRSQHRKELRALMFQLYEPWKKRPKAEVLAQLVKANMPPVEGTGWHRHERDYVVVPMTTGDLHIFDGKMTMPAPLRAGVSYARQIGVEHDVINPNKFEFVFVEIELKA